MKTKHPFGRPANVEDLRNQYPVRARNDIASAFSKWCEMVIRNSGKRLRKLYLPFIGSIQIGLIELRPEDRNPTIVVRNQAGEVLYQFPRN